MANDINKRLDNIEHRVNPPDKDKVLIILDWGDDFILVDGEEIPRADYEARYPDRVEVNWGDDDDDRVIVPVGFDLGRV